MVDTVAQPVLADAVKQIVQTILTQLAAHNVQGAALIQTGVTAVEELVDHSTEVFNLVKSLAPLFVQIYDQVKAWIEEAIPHLKAVWEWAKNLWNSLFGHKVSK